jgi:hypothetical protein
MLRIQSRGFRFWMISRSHYFWSRSFLQIEHFFIITFFFLSSFVLYFFVFFSSYMYLPWFAFCFLHHNSLNPSPNKKISFPLLLHVLNRCFKIFKLLELSRGSSCFPNHFSSFSFRFSHVEFIFFSFLCNVILYISIYNLEIFPVGW